MIETFQIDKLDIMRDEIINLRTAISSLNAEKSEMEKKIKFMEGSL